MKIKTRDQLVDYIASNRGYDFPLFEASKRFKQFREKTISGSDSISIGQPIHSDGLVDSYFLYYRSPEFGNTYASLKNCNIDERNGYNDWYWFTTREEAEEYAGLNKRVFEEGKTYRFTDHPNNTKYVCITVGQGTSVFKILEKGDYEPEFHIFPNTRLADMEEIRS